jgi:hypothetical protein
MALELRQGHLEQQLRPAATSTLMYQKANLNKAKVRSCAARAFCDCPAIISLRPRSQNISKEAQLNPEKDSRIKKARSHVSLE